MLGRHIIGHVIQVLAEEGLGQMQLKRSERLLEPVNGRAVMDCGSVCACQAEMTWSPEKGEQYAWVIHQASYFCFAIRVAGSLISAAASHFTVNVTIIFSSAASQLISTCRFHCVHWMHAGICVM